ncbi:MAG TPA: chloride channel protein [Thermoguttaceae bacterium]|nr:chloride channel protein [Thermoguttaceae bacterium]
MTIILACLIGVLAGYGAVFFTFLINLVTTYSIEPILRASHEYGTQWLAVLWMVPAVGLLLVSWFTRRFAPEAQGHGVPEVILAIGRHDGVIRPRVAVVKILASGFCIGTGSSIGREGPIVQIGSALGSMAGQWFRLPPKDIKVLVAAGAAAGISATFNAPLAGVMFASEIILGSFAVESLAPIVVASVLANVVQSHLGAHGMDPVFPQVYHSYAGGWGQLPSYLVLGLCCGLAAVVFTKLLYYVEDVSKQRLPKWWCRALVLGSLVGISGTVYYALAPEPPEVAPAAARANLDPGRPLPALFGVGYEVVDHAVHLESRTKNDEDKKQDAGDGNGGNGGKREPDRRDKILELTRPEMLAQLCWLLPLALLKPLMTSLALGGGGSGGIFAPSLFIGAALGGSFGLLCNMLIPELSAHPGVYAIVGMGAVVAGTTHGTLSAILIVYEMTDNYQIILPIMIAAGLSGVVARFIDPDSIYLKKLSRREESVARGHQVHHLEHIMVRDVMIRHFPTVRHTDDLTEIIRVARQNLHIESLPVMNDEEQLVGIIRPGDLQRALDSRVPPQLVNAEDIAMTAPIALRTNDNLLEAMRDFGACDVETLPVETGEGASRRVVGLLLRADVMGRYRKEMLRQR